MNKKIIFGFPILVTLFACCLCNLDTRKFLLGCYWQECAPERNFHVLDWKISDTLFPPNSKVSDMMISSEGEGEVESGSQNIFWDDGNGSAGYSIKRYAAIKSAIKDYKFQVEHTIDYESKTPWVRPNEIKFSSSTADNIHIACGKNMFNNECRMMARYQEYTVWFATTIDDEMTYKNFETIVEYIDEEISRRLYP